MHVRMHAQLLTVTVLCGTMLSIAYGKLSNDSEQSYGIRCLGTRALQVGEGGLLSSYVTRNAKRAVFVEAV